MAVKYSVIRHTTPEGKIFIAVTRHTTWKYEHHYRGSILFEESKRFGWHNITHEMVASNLPKEKAIKLKNKLIRRIGEDNCLNQRAFHKKENTNPKNEKQMKEKQTSMMTSTANGVKLSLTFDNRYQSKSGYPIVIRVYKDKKWCYVPTGFKMPLDEFKHMSVDTEKILSDKFSTLKDWCARSVSDGTFSLEGAKSCLKDKANSTTLDGLLVIKMNTLSNKGTQQNYKSTMNWVDKAYPNGLDVKSITPRSIDKIVKLMKSEGSTDTTINVYLSAIKASLNYAIYKGLFDERCYPFKKNAWEADKLTIPASAKRDDRWIDKEEMREVWDKFLETKNIALGLFMFSYLSGGMNLADIMTLKFTNEWLTKDTIRFVRKKTAHKKATTIKLPVSSHIKKLLETLDIEPEDGKLVFSCLEGEYFKRKSLFATRINNTLHRYGFDISMTYARHSFATITTKMKMPATMIEEAMGHSLGGVQSHYIAGWDVEEMMPYFEQLL